MPDNSEGPTLYQGITFGVAILALLMAFITASELRETSEKCVLRPKG